MKPAAQARVLGTRHSGKVQQRALTAAVNPYHAHLLLPGASVIRLGLPLVRDEEARARYVPDRRVDMDTLGDSWSRRHSDDLRMRWSGRAQSQPSKLGLFGTY